MKLLLDTRTFLFLIRIGKGQLRIDTGDHIRQYPVKTLWD